MPWDMHRLTDRDWVKIRKYFDELARESRRHR